jgi:hypothetical protein
MVGGTVPIPLRFISLASLGGMSLRSRLEPGSRCSFPFGGTSLPSACDPYSVIVGFAGSQVQKGRAWRCLVEPDDASRCTDGVRE